MATHGYWEKLIKGRTSRRRVVTGLAGLGASAVALSVIGCSGDDDDGGQSGSSASSSAGSSGSASGAGQAAIDRVVIALNYAGPESNDPRDTGGSPSWQLGPIYENLITHDQETGDYIAGLCSGWEPSADGLSITFKLRDNVKFHDGSPMTADDVLFTYEYAVADPDKGARVRERLDRIEATSPNEVVVHLKQPDVTNYAWLFSSSYTWGAILSRANWEAVGDGAGLTKPPLIGTGPWKFLEREAGNYIRYERFDNHWRKTPDFKEMEFRIKNENSTRQAALLTGETHITQLPRDLQEEAADRGMEVINANVLALNFWMQYLGRSLNIRTGEHHFPNSPLHDDRVRKALNKAINRDELLQAFLDPKSEVMAFGGQFHPKFPGWDESWDPSGDRWKQEYGYDPDDAKALLAAAGYDSGNPFKTHMFASTRPIAEGLDIQQTILGTWRPVGIDAEFITMDEATLDGRAAKFEFDNHIQFDSAQGLPPVNLGSRINSPRLAALNPDYTGVYRDVGIPGLAELFDKATSQLDPDRYDSLMREVGEQLFINHAFIPLFWSPVQFVVRPDAIAGWSMPGVAGGVYSHTEYIEATRA
jgi:peptide/nickel transport system substrate-binding protein